MHLIGKNHSGMRWLLFCVAIQLASTTALVFWWGYLLLAETSKVEHLRMPNMIFAEGAWFLCVIAVSTGFLVWFYYRDRKRSQSLRAFFASLTHELRTPLASLRLQAESIAEVSQPDTYVQTLCARLLQDSAKIEVQVDKALELARIQGGAKLTPRPVDVSEAFQRSKEFWLGTKNNTMNVEEDIDHAVVEADPAALHAVFKNVLDNAHKHGNLKQTPLRIKTSTRENLVEICFENTSHQLNKMQTTQKESARLASDKLGQLFYRGPNSSGAGVGLYLIRSLLKAMGGEAKFEISGNIFRTTLTLKKCTSGREL